MVANFAKDNKNYQIKKLIYSREITLTMYWENGSMILRGRR